MDSSLEAVEAMANIARTLGSLSENWALILFDQYGQVKPVGYVDPDGELWTAMEETIECPLMAMIRDIDGKDTRISKDTIKKFQPKKPRVCSVYSEIYSCVTQKVEFLSDQ